MNKIKDFFHNSNDILLAILIILIAAGVIFWRMQSILDYPAMVAAQQNATTEQSDADNSSDSASDSSSGSASDSTDESKDGSSADKAVG